MLQEKNAPEFWQKLRDMAESGTRLYLDGKQSSAEEIINICFVKEEAVYMPDYILDDEGRLAELRYDKIKER